MEGVELAEAHIGAHILQADFLLVGQIPVVFQQQGFGFGIAADHFFAAGKQPCHIGDKGGFGAAVCGFAAIVVAALQVVEWII